MHYIPDTPAYVCRVCKVPLAVFPSEDGGPPLLTHGRAWEDYDHEVEPVRSNLVPDFVKICDFCGEPGARWAYEGEITRAYGIPPGGGMAQVSAIQEVGGKWSGCDACDVFVRRRDIEGLTERYEQAAAPRRAREYAIEEGETWLRGAQDDGTLSHHRRQLWASYLPTIRHRYLIPEVKPLTPMRPALMPKIRDQLAAFWLTSRARLGMSHDVARAHYIALPGYLHGYDDRFLIETTREMLDRNPGLLVRHCERVSRDLLAGDLYWVSKEYTNLAIRAGKALDDLSIVREELPSINGLMIWHDPIYEITVENGLVVPIRAVAWNLIPAGIWVTVYIQPEHAMSGLDPEVLRREVGFIMPWSSGGGAAFGTHKVDAGDRDNMVMKVLVATWLLMRQAGMTDVVQEKPFKDIAKKYKRAGRPEPLVHVVNIRHKPRPKRSADDDAPARNYRNSWTVGWETGGFWRHYWVGPGRATRDRRWIDPYLARDDLPMKGGEKLPKPTVKVLR